MLSRLLEHLRISISLAYLTQVRLSIKNKLVLLILESVGFLPLKTIFHSSASKPVSQRNQFVLTASTLAVGVFGWLCVRWPPMSADDHEKAKSVQTCKRFIDDIDILMPLPLLVLPCLDRRSVGWSKWKQMRGSIQHEPVFGCTVTIIILAH